MSHPSKYFLSLSLCLSLSCLGISILLYQLFSSYFAVITLLVAFTVVFLNTLLIIFYLSLGFWGTFRPSKFFFSLFFWVGLIRSIGLPLARLAQDKPGLLWTADWAFSAGHAQNILKYGTLFESISYSGSSEAYHIGPSYIAGLFSKLTSLGVDFFLLLLLPLVFYAIFYYFIYVFAFKFCNSAKIACWSVCLFSIMPGPTFQSFRFFGLQNILDVFKSASLHPLYIEYFKQKPFFLFMHNSQFGLIIAFAVLYLVLIHNSKWPVLLLSSLSAISIFTIKPHFAVACFSTVFVFAIYYFYKAYFSCGKSLSLFCFASYIAGSCSYYFLRARSCLFFLVSFVFFYYCYQSFGVQGFYQNKIYLGHFHDSLIAIRSFDLSLLVSSLRQSLYHLYGYISSSRSLILLISLSLSLFYRDGLIGKALIRNFKLVISLYLAGIFIVFVSLYFPISYTAPLPNPISEGLIPSTDDSLPLGFNLYQVTETQLEIFSSLFLCLVFSISLVELAVHSLSGRFAGLHKSRYLLLSLPFAFFAFESFHLYRLIYDEGYLSTFHPTNVADYSDYKDVVTRINQDHSVILTNDVHMGFNGRKFRPVHLSAFSSHKHFLSNVADYHWRQQSDVLSRLKLYMQVFDNDKVDCDLVFETLKLNGITHLVVFRSASSLPILSCSNFNHSFSTSLISTLEIH